MQLTNSPHKLSTRSSDFKKRHCLWNTVHNESSGGENRKFTAICYNVTFLSIICYNSSDKYSIIQISSEITVDANIKYRSIAAFLYDFGLLFDSYVQERLSTASSSDLDTRNSQQWLMIMCSTSPEPTVIIMQERKDPVLANIFVFSRGRKVLMVNSLLRKH